MSTQNLVQEPSQQHNHNTPNVEIMFLKSLENFKKALKTAPGMLWKNTLNLKKDELKISTEAYV